MGGTVGSQSGMSHLVFHRNAWPDCVALPALAVLNVFREIRELWKRNLLVRVRPAITDNQPKAGSKPT
jgi:hypothetical protein